MSDKDVKLSIRISANDQTRGPIAAITARLRAAFASLRGGNGGGGGIFGRINGALKSVFAAVGQVTSAIGSALGTVASFGGALGALAVGALAGATMALKSFIDHFDELGDKSEAIGVSADFLAQMRFAAKKSGAEVEELDSGLQNFTKSLGQARANTGRMTAFLARVSPALLKQLKGAKSNAEAFDLLATATAKLEDPAKRAALAQATLGSAALAPLLARGGAGVKALRDRYVELAGGQQEAVDAASDFDDNMIELDASIQGIKASLVQGLAPALTIVVGKLRDWFAGHREDIKTWAMEFGEKLPGAISAVTEAIGSAVGKLKSFFSTMSDILSQSDAIRAFFLGDKDLEGATGADLMQGPAGLNRVRVRNLLKKANGLTRQEQLQLSQQWFAGSAEISSRDHSEFESERAQAMRDAAQQLREKIGFNADDARRMVQTGGGFNSADLAALAASVAGVTRPQSAKITVDFTNAPRGTRVTTDPTSTADVDTQTGYQLAPSL